MSEDISRQIPCSLLTHKCQPMKENVKFAKRLELQFRIFFLIAYEPQRFVYCFVLYHVFGLCYLLTKLVEGLFFIPLDIDSVLHSTLKAVDLVFDSMCCLQ